MASTPIKKTAGVAETAINKASQIASIVAVVFLVAMMVLTVADVFLRFFFHAPIQGTVELIQYFMVVAGFLGVAWCAIQGGHLKVDMIMDRLTSRFKGNTDSLTITLGMAVVAVVAWQGFEKAQEVQLDKIASAFLDIPAYPFYLIVGISYSLLFLAMIPILVEYIRKAIGK